MPTSAFGPEVKTALDAAFTPQQKIINVVDNGAQSDVTIKTPFPSPEDWRDQWIYFLMVDRFNNPNARPKSEQSNPAIPFDQAFGSFQGGTFEGIRQNLSYIKKLGAGAIWLSPVLKNCQYENGTFHGYGIQNFLEAEPRFASNVAAAKANPTLADDELRDLVDEAHARGLYVIFDIVLNHSGNVFGYVTGGKDNAAEADFRSTPYDIRWHDELGHAAFSDIGNLPAGINEDAVVWPSELHSNSFFRRQGKGADVPHAQGDFASLKQMVSDIKEVDRVLIRAYQYVIARFDIDGFRIDTFKVPNAEFGHVFCNAMREFALSIGKRDFFTFGEITVDEKDFPNFIGRNTKDNTDTPIGIDAALDFPVKTGLESVIKFNAPPVSLSNMYENRKSLERTVITTHGEASGFFVTFLDNHDGKNRFYFQDAASPHKFDDQLTLALGCLFGLQGIPCVYYGTEQGLHGSGSSDANVREALWGKQPSAFDTQHPFFKALEGISKVRSEQPALRYGRQYFRQVSGNGTDFAISTAGPGVMAFSRLLDAQEVLVVANTNTGGSAITLEVVVDASLNDDNGTFRVLFSNKQVPQLPGMLSTHNKSTVHIREFDGSVSDGPIRVLPVTVNPMEIQILRR